MIRPEYGRPVLIAALLLCGAFQRAGAQWNPARQASGDTHVYLDAGVDGAAVATLGVASSLAWRERVLRVRLDGSVAAGSADAADYRARLAIEVPVAQRDAWRLVGLAAVVNRGTSNTIFRGNSVAVDMQANVGWYRRRGFAALELGLERAAVTRLTFTDRYRENFPEARDGWYATTASTARAGVVLGVAVGRTELAARSGVLRTLRGEALIPPLYATLGVGRRF